MKLLLEQRAMGWADYAVVVVGGKKITGFGVFVVRLLFKFEYVMLQWSFPKWRPLANLVSPCNYASQTG